MAGWLAFLLSASAGLLDGDDWLPCLPLPVLPAFNGFALGWFTVSHSQSLVHRVVYSFAELERRRQRAPHHFIYVYHSLLRFGFHRVMAAFFSVLRWNLNFKTKYNIYMNIKIKLYIKFNTKNLNKKKNVNIIFNKCVKGEWNFNKIHS